MLDEFQEIVDIDPELPKLMRSVFELQPDVAHVYLGSKRHMMRADLQRRERAVLAQREADGARRDRARAFRGYIEAQFERTGKRIESAAVDGVLDATLGHPYATQELCYFVWGETPEGEAGDEQYDAALEKLLRSEHAHFGLVWEKAARAQRLVLQRDRARARPAAHGRVPPPPRSPRPVERAAGASTHS